MAELDSSQKIDASRNIRIGRVGLYTLLAGSSWWCLKRSPGMPWADGSYHILISYAAVNIYKNAWRDDPKVQTNQIDFYLEHKRSPILTGQVSSAWTTLHPKFTYVLQHLGSVPAVVDWFEVRNWQSWLDDFILLLDLIALGSIAHFALPIYDTRWPWLLCAGFVGSRYILPHLAESIGASQDDGKVLGLIITNYLSARALEGEILIEEIIKDV